MVQAVWNTAHGDFLEFTAGHTGDQVSRLGVHVDPILAAFAPLWIVLPSPMTLAAVQIVAVALGALPVFWLARRHTGSDALAGTVAFSYLVYPWIAWTALDAFHPVTLAVPLLLYCVWFLDTERIGWFAICASLVLLTGESMGIAVAALGAWYALARGQRRVGGLIAGAGIGWTVVALYVVIPAFSGGESVYYGAFDHVGGSPTGLVRTAVTDPLAILEPMVRSDDLVYLFLLAAPLGGLFVLAPGLAALALPQALVNLLADGGTVDPHEHYVAAVLPFLFAAVAVGLGRLGEATRARAAALLLMLSVAATITVGPWPGSLLGAAAWDPLPDSSSYVRSLERAVGLVPEDAPVSSTNRLGASLSARKHYYSVPVLGRAEWVVLERADVWVPRPVSGESDEASVRHVEAELERSGEWVKVFDENGILVFRKVRP